jgi:hypothetical protein
LPLCHDTQRRGTSTVARCLDPQSPPAAPRQHNSAQLTFALG